MTPAPEEPWTPQKFTFIYSSLDEYFGVVKAIGGRLQKSTKQWSGFILIYTESPVYKSGSEIHNRHWADILQFNSFLRFKSLYPNRNPLKRHGCAAIPDCSCKENVLLTHRDGSHAHRSFQKCLRLSSDSFFSTIFLKKLMGRLMHHLNGRCSFVAKQKCTWVSNQIIEEPTHCSKKIKINK